MSGWLVTLLALAYVGLNFWALIGLNNWIYDLAKRVVDLELRR